MSDTGKDVRHSERLRESSGRSQGNSEEKLQRLRRDAEKGRQLYLNDPTRTTWLEPGTKQLIDMLDRQGHRWLGIDTDDHPQYQKTHSRQGDASRSASTRDKGKARAGDNTQHTEKLINSIRKHAQEIRKKSREGASNTAQVTEERKKTYQNLRDAACRLSLAQDWVADRHVSDLRETYPDVEKSKSGEYAKTIYENLKTLNESGIRGGLKIIYNNIEKEMERQD